MGKNLIDKYSYLHYSVGIIFYYYKIPFNISLLIHIIFEFLENTKDGMYIINKYLKFWPGGKQSKDTYINSIFDTIFFCIGWYTAFLISKKYK